MKIKVLYKQVGKPAEVREIDDDTAVLRELVGGHFSGYWVCSFVAEPQLRNVYLMCHDEGKLIGLPANFFLGSELLVGNVIFYAGNEHGEGTDLSDLQVQLLKAHID